MSEEGGHESIILFENQSLMGLSNSGGGTGSDEKVPLNDESETKKIRKRGRGGGGGAVATGGRGGESDDHEMHVVTERERRKKMRNMFSNLHALLPQLSPKADKSTIVDEAVNYIKTLQQTLQTLEKKKLEKLQGANGATPSKITQNQASDTSREAFLADQVSNSSHNNQQLAIKFSNSLSVSNNINNNNNNNNNNYQFPALFQTWTSPNVVLNVCGHQAQISVCSLKKPGLFTTICSILGKHKLEVTTAHVSSTSNQSLFMIQVHYYYASGASNNQLSDALQVEEIFKQAAAEMMFWVSS